MLYNVKVDTTKKEPNFSLKVGEKRKTVKIQRRPATTTANIIFPVQRGVTVDTD